MSATKCNITSITFSLIGLFSILLIWVAGSPKYGMFSRASYLVGGFEVLLIIGVTMLGLGAFFLCLSPAKNIEQKILPLLVLLTSAMPTLLFGLVLLLRYLAGES